MLKTIENNKKILFISNVCKKIDNFSLSSMMAAKESGFDFHIAVNHSDMADEDICKYECKHNISIHQIDFVRNPFNPFNIKAYFQLKELMKKECFDIVHCNTPVGGLLGRICSYKLGVKKVIYMAHGFHFYKGAPPISILFKWAEILLAKITDIIITINNEDYNSSLQFKLRENGKVYFVPGVGIEVDHFEKTQSKRNELLDEIEADGDSVLIISVGELNKNKNNKIVIKAIKKLNHQNIHYFVCGVGNQLDKLMSLVKENNLEKKVHFLGYRTDIPELLKSCDIFVLPSFREGLSRSLIEAMSSGLPCIASKIRGNIDLIEEGLGGYLCNPFDEDSFFKALNKLIVNRELRKSMGEYNLMAVKKYDLENVIQNIKKIYGTLV